MVDLITGSSGKGKTSYLIDTVNEAIKSASGNIVYIDKSSKHMYELNNKIRLIDASQYPIKGADELVGFICGIISQDHDVEQIFIDGFGRIAQVPVDSLELEHGIGQLENISNMFNVKFIVGITADKEQLSEGLQAMVTLAL